MDKFVVALTPEAQSDIRALSGEIRLRILDKLEWMGTNVAYLHHQSLKGKEWQGLLKYRVGNYRIVYQLDTSAKQIIVIKVGHRRDVYEP